ncbi:MAG: hypothetical protein JW860_15820 [Sedimentisphaerales bacterium]|nr:hypothetical protein [Sedimentisphaerales bacterium]
MTGNKYDIRTMNPGHRSGSNSMIIAVAILVIILGSVLIIWMKYVKSASPSAQSYVETAPQPHGPQYDLVQAQLIADAKAIAPGGQFTLGVLFTMKQDSHIYGPDPGDAGLPTRVKFTGPAGFQFGELKYPPARRLESEGNIVTYVYEDSVLLMAPVTAPLKLSPGTEITFIAEANWLACTQVCVPGKMRLELSLPVAEISQPADDNKAIFAKWR